MNRLYFSAALFNWLIAVAILLAPQLTLHTLAIPVSGGTLFFAHLTAVMVFYFGLIYFFEARFTGRFSETIKVAAYAKISIAAVGLADFGFGLVAWPITLLLLGDVIYALLFFRQLKRQ